jgi:hypothetical protein
MPIYRVHRMKEGPRQQFRWAPHSSGVTQVRPRDFESAGETEARGLYDAWLALRGTEAALVVGDVLESEDGRLAICKYVGFEEARWVMPEVRTGLEGLPAAVGAPLPAGAAPSGL